MFGKLPAILFLACATTVGLPGPGVFAADCLSPKQARAAVQSGDAVPLSRMLKQIRAATGGEILPEPRLCDAGGRLIYRVKVLKQNGEVETLTVDAASGSISGY